MPPSLSNVPPWFWGWLIVWDHTTLVTIHPGTLRMHELLSAGTGGRTCSPIFINISSCPTYVSRPKFPEHAPQHPRSHIVLDFVTNLPESFANTVIMVVLAQFSCSLHLIPLPMLPTAFETAELCFNHLFRDYGILEDIINNRWV